MAESIEPEELPRELTEHPRRSALSSLVRTCAVSAARDENVGFGRDEQPGIEQGLLGDLGREDAATEYGNVVELIERGCQSPQEEHALSVLLALGLAELDGDEPEKLAPSLVWLATHTPLDAFPYVDGALGDRASELWRAVADVAMRPTLQCPALGCAEALTAAAAMASSSSPTARSELALVAERADNAALRRLLATPSVAPTLSGELSPAPRNPWVTVALALTLVLALTHVARLIGRLVLGYRRPAQLRLSPQGLELVTRTELLGKVVRNSATIVPVSNLARVTREVRFARVGMYVGLGALVLGSYLGVGLFVDGLRVPGGSLSLLGLGALLVVVGLAVDFVLSGLTDDVRGRCRLVVVPRKGRKLCIGALDAEHADRMLAAISEAPSE
jgi:hypothetical protein